MTVSILRERLRARIGREGPVSFATFMETALYDPDAGFFSSGGGAGRAGRDFVTSPEVGGLFGALVARHLDRVWRRLGEPDPFVVVEAGAGRGRLAADVLRAGPECRRALRYFLVERSAALRHEQHGLLRLEPADEALGPSVHGVDPDDPSEVVPGTGPIMSSMADLPALALDGVVLANELLDNLAVRIVERRAGAWAEVRVGLRGDELVEVAVPAPPDLDLADLPPEAPDGARLPVPVGAAEWLDRSRRTLVRGELVVIDYVATWSELIERGQDGWLRTYRGHGRAGSPLADPGSCDITSDVPFEALVAAAGRAGLVVDRHTDQAGWLRSLGLETLRREAVQAWDAGAARADLPALEARSRIGEADALVDPAGLGAHRVIVLRPAGSGNAGLP